MPIINKEFIDICRLLHIADGDGVDFQRSELSAWFKDKPEYLQKIIKFVGELNGRGLNITFPRVTIEETIDSELADFETYKKLLAVVQLNSKSKLENFITRHSGFANLLFSKANNSEFRAAINYFAERYNDHAGDLNNVEKIEFLTRIQKLLLAATEPNGLEFLLPNQTEKIQQVESFISTHFANEDGRTFFAILARLPESSQEMSQLLQKNPKLWQIFAENQQFLSSLVPVVQTPSQTDSKNDFNFVDALQDLGNLIGQKLLPELENTRRVAQFNQWFEISDYYNLSETGIDQSSDYRFKKDSFYQALAQLNQDLNTFAIQLKQNSSSTNSGNEALQLKLTAMQKLQAFDNAKLQSLQRILSSSVQETVKNSVSHFLGRLNRTKKSSGTLKVLSTAVQSLLEKRFELKSQIITANQNPAKIAQALESFLLALYPSLNENNIDTLSVQVLESLVQNLNDLSFSQIHKLRQISNTTDGISGLQQKILGLFIKNLAKLNANMSPLNPHHPHNPFIKQGISFEQAKILQQVYEDTQMLAPGPLSDKQIKAQIETQLLENLDTNEQIDLKDKLRKLATQDKVLGRFYHCLNQKLTHLNLHPENSKNPFRELPLSPLVFAIYKDYAAQGHTQELLKETISTAFLRLLVPKQVVDYQKALAKLQSSDPMLATFYQNFREAIAEHLSLANNATATQAKAQVPNTQQTAAKQSSSWTTAWFSKLWSKPASTASSSNAQPRSGNSNREEASDEHKVDPAFKNYRL